MWLQNEVKKGKLIVVKIDGKENPADLMTKHLPLLSLYPNRDRRGFLVRRSIARFARFARDGVRFARDAAAGGTCARGTHDGRGRWGWGKRRSHVSTRVRFVWGGRATRAAFDACRLEGGRDRQSESAR